METQVLPTVTEGKAFNLSCSSIGGSPPPEILWYKDGATEVEEGSVFKAGRTRTEPSSALLTVVPKKEVSQFSCPKSKKIHQLLHKNGPGVIL